MKKAKCACTGAVVFHVEFTEEKCFPPSIKHTDCLHNPRGFRIFTYQSSKSGCSAARLARLPWAQEVPGSNPGIPTLEIEVGTTFKVVSILFYYSISSTNLRDFRVVLVLLMGRGIKIIARAFYCIYDLLIVSG
jgi:hypothetical protein